MARLSPMTRRLKDITLLLGALLDAPFAQPKTWTGQLVARNAKRGEAPSKRVKCPNCDGEGAIRKRGIMHGCTRCGGADISLMLPNEATQCRLDYGGRGRGWIEVDDYTRRQISSVRTGLTVEWKTVPCDVCGGEGVTLNRRWRGDNNRCLRCNGGGRLELTLQQWRATRTVTYTLDPSSNGSSGDPVLDCMTLRLKSGSFDELLGALAELKTAWPALHRLTLERYVLGQNLRSERLQRLVDEGGLEFLSARMPDEIKLPAGLRQRERRKEMAA
jgi:hypothetical protein